MKEQLISFETAKLAKEKGFDIIPRFGNEASIYDKNGEHVYYSNYGFMYSGLNDGYIGAPTQSLLQKWLREKHNIHVNPTPYRESTIPNDTEITGYYVGIIYNALGKKIGETEDYNYVTYEEALEIGLQQALKLI